MFLLAGIRLVIFIWCVCVHKLQAKFCNLLSVTMSAYSNSFVRGNFPATKCLDHLLIHFSFKYIGVMR